MLLCLWHFEFNLVTKTQLGCFTIWIRVSDSSIFPHIYTLPLKWYFLFRSSLMKFPWISCRYKWYFLFRSSLMKSPWKCVPGNKITLRWEHASPSPSVGKTSSIFPHIPYSWDGWVCGKGSNKSLTQCKTIESPLEIVQMRRMKVYSACLRTIINDVVPTQAEYSRIFNLRCTLSPRWR